MEKNTASFHGAVSELKEENMKASIEGLCTSLSEETSVLNLEFTVPMCEIHISSKSTPPTHTLLKKRKSILHSTDLNSYLFSDIGTWRASKMSTLILGTYRTLRIRT